MSLVGKRFAHWKDLPKQDEGTWQKAHIVYSENNYEQDNWNEPYPNVIDRTYEITINNKVFGDYIGYSLFGTCINGDWREKCVRLESYRWNIDYVEIIE